MLSYLRIIFIGDFMNLIPEGISLNIWILSQVFTLFALISIVIALTAKKKSKTLLFTIIFNAFSTVGSIFLQNWILAGIVGVATFRDIVFLLRETYAPDNKLLSLFTLILFLAISFTVSWLTNNWWFDFLLMAAALFIIYGSWAKGVHLIRISRIVFCVLAIVNRAMRFDVIGIVIEVVCIVAIIYFYIKYFKIQKEFETQV